MLLKVLAATKLASDRHKSANNFIRHAELLEMFKGLEPYGYELDVDLKVCVCVCVCVYVCMYICIG